MKRLTYVLATSVAVELFSGLFIAVALTSPHPRFIWNASASAPIGLYRVTPVKQPRLGELVVFMPPEPLSHFLDERGYLAAGVPLLKHVAAVAGATVCRRGAMVTVDGRPAASALQQDSRGRTLPVWHGCRRVRVDEVFLLNAVPDSMDGRYFGLSSLQGVLGRATPVLTRNAAAAPLAWHGLANGTTRLAIPHGPDHD